MKVLLDTHAILWWFVGDARLSARVLAAMDDAEEVSYSIVTLWEVGMKMARGGFDFPMPTDWEVALPALAARFDMKETAIDARHCRLIQDLPFHHKDPFDRMLIAQALNGGFTVVGSDERFDDYGVKRLW